MKKNLFRNYLLGFLVALFSATGALAQPMFFTSGGTSANSFPLNSTTNRVQWLYTPADFNLPPSGGNITKLYIKSGTATASVTFTNFTVKMATTAATATNATSWFTTSQVYFQASQTFTGVTNGGWMVVQLQAPFYWPAGTNLIMDLSVTSTTGVTVLQNSTQPNRREWGTSVAATPTSSGSGLVDMGVDMSPAAPNNASTVNIPSPTNFCPGTYPVKARIKNAGNNVLNNVKVNWTIDGSPQPQISFNYPLDTFGGAGINDTLLTLGNVAFPANIVKIIKVWTSLPNGVNDTVNVDDTAVRSFRTSLSGVYTVNGTTPDFPTLDSAASALNLYGVCGPVTMNVRSGTYTNQKALLNDISGTSSVNTVTFQPEAGVSGAVTFTHNATLAANNYVFSLNSTKWVTIKKFLFTPTSTTFATTLAITGSPANDSFINNKITNPVVASTSTNMACIYATGLTGSRMVVQNDTFTNGSYQMYWWGSSTTAMNMNSVIENNLFQNPYYMGCYLYYQNSLKYRQNVLTQSGSTTNTTFYGILAYYCYDSSYFSNNTLNITNTTATSSLYPMYIYQNSGSALIPGYIEGNRINASSTTGSNYGLTHYYGVNSIVRNNAILSTTTSGTCYGFYNWYPSNCEYYNNAFHANSATGATVYGGYLYNNTSYTGSKFNNNIFSKQNTNGVALYMYSPTYQETDYNLIYPGTGTNLVQSVTLPAGTFTTLQGWRTASNRDKNSLVYRPPYTSATTNLQPNPADSAAWALQGRGVHSPNNSSDITGQPRVTTRPAGVPDIGPWEFTPTVNPPFAIPTPALPVAGTTQTFTFGQDTVEVINWAASSTVPTGISVQAYSGTVPPPVFPAGDFMWFYNQINATGSNAYSYTAHTYYDEPWRGTNVVESALRLAKKDGAGPWVTYNSPASSTNTLLNIISAPALTTLNAAFTGRGEQCTGGGTLPSLVTSPLLTTPRCAGDSIVINADDPNNLAGMAYQWQYSFSGAPGTWQDVVNGSNSTTLSYTTGPLTDTVYYRVKTRCLNGGIDTPSAAYFVPVLKPLVLTKTDSVRCGPGTVNLYATVTPGATLSWYANAIGGSPLGTGSPFTTPIILATTTFYAEASGGGIGQQTVGPVSPMVLGSAASINTASYLEYFNVTANLNLQTVDVYPTAALNSPASIRVYTTSNQLVGEVFYTVQQNSGTTPQTVTLNMPLAPGNYYMAQGTSVSLMRNSAGAVYPYTSPLLNITGCSVGAGWYAFFYNWKYNNSCQSPRIPVTATVLTPPAFAIAADKTVCYGEIANLSVVTPQSNYDTVGWTPITDLYTNAAATVPYNGLSAFNIWSKSTTPGVNTWVATAYQAANSCVSKDTVNIFVQPSSATLTALPDTICVSGTSLLQLNSSGGAFAPNSVYWQSSPNGIPATYTTVYGPNAATTYTTPTLTSGTTYYKTMVTNSANASCYDNFRSVTVQSPQVSSVVGSSHCGPGPVTLLAYGSAGTTLRWYATPTGGGQPLQTGGTYTTPIIYQNTTYWVTASTDNDTGTAGPVTPTAVGPTGTGTNSTNYMQFDVLTNTTLKSVDIFPTSPLNTAGTIQILNSANNVVATVPYTTTVTNGNMQRVQMNVNLPAATGYRIRQGATSATLTYNTGGAAYPYTSSDIVITGNNWVNGYYLFFYNWKWLSGCESPRVPVTAVINPSPAVSFTPPTHNICFGDTTTISAVSPNPGYQFEWTQLGIFGPTITVYPQVTTDYTLFSIDTSNGAFAGCTHYDTIRVTVFPRPVADVIPLGPATFCAGDSLKLVAITNPAYTYQWQINGANLPGAVDTTITVFAPGNYTVRTLLGFCYQTSLPQSVIVNALPQPTITSTNNVLSTQPFSSYQWLKDGQIIYGATNQFYVPQGPGDYEVAVTDINGCTNTSSIFRQDPVGIPNVNGVGGIVSIKPNPVHDVLIIEAPVAVTAVVTTLDGRLVLRQADAKRVDMREVADGVYMLRVLDKDGRNLKTEKIVKTAW